MIRLLKVSAVVVVVVVALFLASSPAGADHVVQVATADAERGDQCTVSTANNRSVWPGNTLWVTSGQTRLSVPGVEDVLGGSSTVDIVAEGPVSAAVSTAPHKGRGTSLKATIVCTPGEPSTTTTEAVTTTTVLETTTTEAEQATTTTVLETTTTEAETTTTELEATTTTGLETTTTTVPTTTTTVDTGCGPDMLACTGPREWTGAMAAAGLVAILLGTLALLTLRRPTA